MSYISWNLVCLQGTHRNYIYGAIGEGKEMSHTQKSMSRLPALPNSRSPTWKVTVILSSLRRLSWKHSTPRAGSTMLCATTAWKAMAAARRLLAAERKSIFPKYRPNREEGIGWPWGGNEKQQKELQDLEALARDMSFCASGSRIGQHATYWLRLG